MAKITIVLSILQTLTVTFAAHYLESPFSIQDTLVGDTLAAKRIRNAATGEYVEVITDYGGLVEDLVLRSWATGRLRKVLLTHDNDAAAVIENTWWQSMLLLPWANRIAYVSTEVYGTGRYSFLNVVYNLPLNEISKDPPLVNALHGFMNGKKLRVTKQRVTKTFALVELSYHFDKPLPGYPFTFDVSILYILRHSDFSMSFVITNRMESTPMPFFMGWHPYFLCTPHKSYVVLDKCTPWNHVELDANMDPTGSTSLYKGLDGSEPIGGTAPNPTFYDDEFKPVKPYNPGCEYIETALYDEPSNQTVVLWQDSSFRLVHVFTGNVGTIAIEPMSGMADAYNNHDHLSILSGGETWSGSVGIYVI